jgi:hypothetical protein
LHIAVYRIWNHLVLLGYQRVKGEFDPEIVGHGYIKAKSNNHPTGAIHERGLSQFRGFYV